MIRTATGIALALSLAACGGAKDSGNGSAPMGAATPKVVAPQVGETRKLSGEPMSQTQIEEYHGSVESAMDRIPPELRADFQKAFECQAGKNQKLKPAEQIEMDGSWIVKKTEQLSKDRAAALAC